MCHSHGLINEILSSEMPSKNSLVSSMDVNVNSWKKKSSIVSEPLAKTMKKTFLLPILVVLMPLSVSADPETYDAYKTRLAATCEDNKEWSKDTS